MDLPRDEYITIDGVRTRHWICGEGPSSLVMVHGVTESVETWSRNLAALSARHRVHALDLVGSGRSDKPRMEYSFASLAAFVRAYMDAVGLRRASLVGHSLGGGVALELAMGAPDRVDKLVLVSPAGLSREMNLFLRLPTVPGLGRLLTRPSRAGAAMGLKSCVFDPALVTPEAISLHHELAALPGAQDAFLATLRTLNDVGGLRPALLHAMTSRLPQVTAPTLLVWGRQDRIQPLAAGQRARDALPHAALHVFEQCGHLAHYEHPVEFNALALDFLAGNASV